MAPWSQPRRSILRDTSSPLRGVRVKRDTRTAAEQRRSSMIHRFAGQMRWRSAWRRVWPLGVWYSHLNMCHLPIVRRNERTDLTFICLRCCCYDALLPIPGLDKRLNSMTPPYRTRFGRSSVVSFDLGSALLGSCPVAERDHHYLVSRS